MLTIKPSDRVLTGLKFIDLFAGIGGFRLALSSLGGECVFSSEWDAAAQLVYAANFGEVPYGDITKIPVAKIPAHDILCAGFPCQPFSIAGSQNGFADTRGTLFFNIVNIAAHHKPRWLLLENVKNLGAHDKGRTLKTILASLSRLGYDVYHKVLNAADYGIPQARERVYIVAMRQDAGLPGFEFPQPVSAIKRRFVCDILLPPKETEHLIVNNAGIVLDVTSPAMISTLAGLPTRPVRAGHLGLGRQGERIYHVDAPGITISAAGGGIGGKTGLYYVNGVVRKLHPRECARMQGFPESFEYDPSPTKAYKQFGNSVAVDVLQQIMLGCAGS